MYPIASVEIICTRRVKDVRRLKIGLLPWSWLIGWCQGSAPQERDALTSEAVVAVRLRRLGGSVARYKSATH